MSLSKLFQPSIIDYTVLNPSDVIKVEIFNTTYRFSSTSGESGTDVTQNPIFGHKAYKNNVEVSSSDYGLPWFKIQKGSAPKIIFDNQTDFTFNLHFHGLATNGYIDGVSEELIFGKSTLIGPETVLNFPLTVNNQCLIWYHAHNMFISINYIYGGLAGLMLIEDVPTKWLSETFQYQDNHILLQINDVDLDEEGVQTTVNITSGKNRSCFTAVNGKIVANWYTTGPNAPFVDSWYHTCHKNLVKIDMLNSNVNWRVYHIGVCDRNQSIKKFYLIQCDQGLLNPSLVDMTFLYTGSRLSILIDMNDFVNGEAFLFFYDYDLTEIIQSSAVNSALPYSSLLGEFPDPSLSSQTPYPTPIPSTSPFGSSLTYPEVETIPQISGTLENGFIPQPSIANKRNIVKIIFENTSFTNCNNNTAYLNFPPFHCPSPSLHCFPSNPDRSVPVFQSLSTVLQQIRFTIFDYRNPDTKNIVSIPNFEHQINYLPILNKNYFYNIPTLINNNPPIRNFILFADKGNNSQSGGMSTGTTEYIQLALRIMCDLWNSVELDLDYALTSYQSTPNQFKPSILPTSLFTIYKTDDTYSNTAMISNDTLFLEIYDQTVAYGDFDQTPLVTKFIIFPATSLMDIQQWTDLVNETFKKTAISIPGYPSYEYVSDVISCDWSFFPFAVPMETDRTIYIKSAAIITTNQTSFTIRLNARMMLIQYFGKPLYGQPLNQPYADEYPDLFTPCDEKALYGILNAEIQDFWPFYATDDPNLQLPIACMRRDAELIIAANTSFVGLYDGFYNNNLNVFTVKYLSGESWTYINSDPTDSHCLHFHLTSGFVTCQNNSVTLINQPTYNFFYSRDIYQIGAQCTLSFFIIFPDYPSFDPDVPSEFLNIGGVIHCHFLVHNDSNGMMIQFRVGR